MAVIPTQAAPQYVDALISSKPRISGSGVAVGSADVFGFADTVGFGVGVGDAFITVFFFLCVGREVAGCIVEVLVARGL